jgi:2-oxo-4-hydroxy-4-carboxy-5-ureidoimidazoline decarboxylase
MRLDDLNALDEDAAVNELLRCCGSSRWARRMAAERPFAGAAALTRTADAIWQSLDAADWLEAFGAHPRIGERTTSAWASAEQSGSASATGAVLERLAAANRDYEVRFGYIFIVCATGRTAGEMLALLERRLPHAPQDEIRIAAEEQRKITRLRLMKLLNLEPDTTT